MKKVCLIVLILSIACGLLAAKVSNKDIQEYDFNTNNVSVRDTKIVTGVVSMNELPLSNVQVKIIINDETVALTFTNSIGHYELYFDSSENEVALSIPIGADYYGIYKTIQVIGNIVNTTDLNLIPFIQNNNLIVGRVGYLEGFENTQDAMTYLHEYLSENQNQCDELFTFYCNTQEIELINLNFSNLNYQNNIRIKLICTADNITVAEFNNLTNLEINIHGMNFVNNLMNSAPLHIINSTNSTYYIDNVLNPEVIIEEIDNSTVYLTNSHFEGYFPQTPVRVILDDNNSNNNSITISNC